jgi:dTDP-4-amino-4,6-dideoxygalactose transaminase
MDRLNEVAKKHGLFVVEDACHSWGSQWKGKGTGALGDCGVFSFQESKNITSGEGGIILTDDENLADMCRSYTNCGRGKDKPWYEHYVLGSNLRLTEFQAALLSAQLTRLEDQTLTRMRNAAILENELKSIPGVTVFRDEPRMTRRAYHMYPFRVKVPDHAGFAKALSAEGVRAGLPYPHPLYKNPLFLEKGQGAKFCPISCPYYGKEIDYSKDCCPVCEELLGDMIWIWHTTLLVGEQAALDMAKAVKKVMANLSEIPSNA